jgi:glutamate 5-kinase
MNFLDHKKNIVIKIGSALLVKDGVLRKDWLENLAQNIAKLTKEKSQITVVTSGAIALGRGVFGDSKNKLSLEEKQASAAIGQINLMSHYRDSFKKSDLDVAQILLTASDCNSRQRYLNLQNTISTLLKNNIIPIINENDSVAVDEIKIGDNDRLAARVAQMISADLLILFSDIDGLYDKNPKTNSDAKLIVAVEKVTKEIENMAGGSVSMVGTGGMVTKIQAAKMAALGGCKTIITSGVEKNALCDLFLGEKKYTIFHGEKNNKSRKKWLSGLINARGEVIINNCAKEVLLNKKTSLLPIGVVGVRGDFDAGEAIFIKDEMGNHIASGVSNYNASEVNKILEKKSNQVKEILGEAAKKELVHIDNLVIVSVDNENI